MGQTQRRLIERVVLDDKARARIVALYTVHDVNPPLIARRFGTDPARIVRILREAGVYRGQGR